MALEPQVAAKREIDIISSAVGSRDWLSRNLAIDSASTDELLTSVATSLEGTEYSAQQKAAVYLDSIKAQVDDAVSASPNDILRAGADRNLSLVARSYYQKSAAADSFRNQPPTSRNLNASQRGVIQTAMSRAPMGQQQLAYSDMATALLQNSDIDFKQTIDVIQSSLAEYDSAMTTANPIYLSSKNNVSSVASFNENLLNAAQQNRFFDMGSLPTSISNPSQSNDMDILYDALNSNDHMNSMLLNANTVRDVVDIDDYQLAQEGRSDSIRAAITHNTMNEFLEFNYQRAFGDTATDPVNNEVRLENRDNLRAVAEIHYNNSPNLPDFINQAPLNPSLPNDYKSGINNILSKQPIGSQQFVFSELQAAMLNNPDITLNQTMGVIRSSLSEIDQVSSTLHADHASHLEAFNTELRNPSPTPAAPSQNQVTTTTESEVERVLEPVVEPVIEPVIEPEPVVEPEPVIEPVVEPEPVIEPANQTTNEGNNMATAPQPTPSPENDIQIDTSKSLLSQAIQRQGDILSDVDITPVRVEMLETFIAEKISSGMPAHQTSGAAVDSLKLSMDNNLEVLAGAKPSRAEGNELKAITTASFESAVKEYYNTNPVLQDYMETPPFSKAITPLEEKLITEAFEGTPIGLKQSVYSMLNDVVSRDPNLSLDETLSTINRSFAGFNNTNQPILPATDINKNEHTLFERRLSSLAIDNPDFVAEYRNGDNTQMLRDAVVARGGNQPYPQGQSPAESEARVSSSAKAAELENNRINNIKPFANDMPQNAVLDDPFNLDGEDEDYEFEQTLDSSIAEPESATIAENTTQAPQGNNIPQESYDAEYGSPVIDYSEMPNFDDLNLSYSQDEMGYQAGRPDDQEGVYDQQNTQDNSTAAQNPAQQASSDNIAATAASLVTPPPRSEVEILTAHLENNLYYQQDGVELGVIEDRLVDADKAINNIGASIPDDMRVAILHEELGQATHELEEKFLAAEGLTLDEKEIIRSSTSEALNIASRNHLNNSDRVSNHVEPYNITFGDGLNRSEQAVLLKTTLGLPLGARQLAVSQLAETRKTNPNLPFADTVNSIRQSISDFDQTYSLINPDHAPHLDKFQSSFDRAITQSNAKENQTETVVNPDFSPSVAPMAAATQTQERPNTQPNSENNTQSPAADTTNATTTPTPTDSATAATAALAASIAAAAAAANRQQSQDREIADTANPRTNGGGGGGGGGGTSFTLFGGSNINTAENTQNPVNVAAAEIAAQAAANNEPPAPKLRHAIGRAITTPVRDLLNGNIRAPYDTTPAQTAAITQDAGATTNNDMPLNNNTDQENADALDLARHSNRDISSPSPATTTGEGTVAIPAGASEAQRASDERDAVDAEREQEQEVIVNPANAPANTSDSESTTQQQQQQDQEARQAQAAEQVATQAQQAAIIPAVPSTPTATDGSEGSEPAPEEAPAPSDEKAASKDGNKSDLEGLSDDQVITEEAIALAASLASQAKASIMQSTNEVNAADTTITPEDAQAKATDLAENLAADNAAAKTKQPEVVADTPNENPETPAPKPKPKDGDKPTVTEAAATPAVANTNHFDNAFADDTHNGLRKHHEALMEKYADGTTSREELYSETEKFLEQHKDLSEQAKTLSDLKKGDDAALEQIKKGLEETSKMKDDIFKQAESKNLLDPDHPDNKAIAAADAEKGKKGGLAGKFEDANKAMQEAMDMVAAGVSKVVASVSGLFGGGKK